MTNSFDSTKTFAGGRQNSGGIFEGAKLDEQLSEVEARISAPDFWSNQTEAQKVMQRRRRLDEDRTLLESLRRRDDDIGVLIEWSAGGEDVGDDLARAVGELHQEVDAAESRKMLSGEHDRSNAIVTIHPGAGGTESQDWASMLQRMYMRWAEAHDDKVELLEESPGEEAGVKSATLRISGENAYGWLKTESGVHRLVRISPFDSNARRHTSFASVWVYPAIDDTIEIDIAESDVRTDVYRASGAGGQHVNKTESAVRLTHVPTGIVVACQTERSQHRNRELAWKMLRARLYEAELQKREAAAQAEHESKSDIGWGHQIRSYVLQPYQMVKDLRTGVETSNTGGVLDGDLDQFLEASLAQRLKGNKASSAAD